LRKSTRRSSRVGIEASFRGKPVNFEVTQANRSAPFLSQMTPQKGALRRAATMVLGLIDEQGSSSDSGPPVLGKGVSGNRCYRSIIPCFSHLFRCKLEQGRVRELAAAQGLLLRGWGLWACHQDIGVRRSTGSSRPMVEGGIDDPACGFSIFGAAARDVFRSGRLPTCNV
jgi:hypothetical protein